MSQNEPQFETLIVAVGDGVQIITLNRPEAMNTINDAMTHELLTALEMAARDSEVRAVLLRATGRAFCAGFELGAMQSEGAEAAFQAKRSLAEINKISLAILGLEKPVVAAVNGAAVGGGFCLVLCSDLAIASEMARFSVIYARRGLMSDLGINYMLPRYVGLRKAKELIFTACMIDAAEAEKLGLINQVVSPNALDDEALGLAKRLASGPTKALGLSKMAIHRALDSDLATSLELETWGQALCIQTQDVIEGWTAFLEKREPAFKGR
jgi:2-(1,2-epoxy-1,2-dihydrophenyl)acetyl-CoA isomerase